MQQGKPQQCPLNVIYIQVLRGHCSVYCMGAGRNLFIDSILGSYSIPEIEIPPRSKIWPQCSVHHESATTKKEKYDYIRRNLYLSLIYTLLLLLLSLSLPSCPSILLCILSSLLVYPPLCRGGHRHMRTDRMLDVD